MSPHGAGAAPRNLVGWFASALSAMFMVELLGVAPYIIWLL
jgi:hypothetical protein